MNGALTRSVRVFRKPIAVADDSTATIGTVPTRKPDNPSVASRTFEMIWRHPYRYTSGDVIFAVFAERHGIPEEERAAAREEFYSRGQPCLRSSDLGKRYGWGIHADGAGRIALVGVAAGLPDLQVRLMRAKPYADRLFEPWS